MRLFFNGRVLKWETFCDFGEWIADCNVRNELTDSRALGDPRQVVYAMTGNRYDRFAYMPRRFPEGTFKVLSITEKDPADTYTWPYFIHTDACQAVTVWDLDREGGYLRPTSRRVMDYGYGLHHSSSRTTLGCIRIVYEEDVRAFAHLLQKEMDNKIKSTLSVNYII